MGMSHCRRTPDFLTRLVSFRSEFRNIPVQYVASPHLANPEWVKDFEAIIEDTTDANV
jgi:hypothetical protein